jgi:simple sugar transport system permease protein
MSQQVTTVPAVRGEGFRFTRQIGVGIVGIIVAALMFAIVSLHVATEAISTLRITFPGARPIDPPLADIPLPTVATVGVICALLVAGAAYMIVRQPSSSVPVYVGTLIFAVIFIILLWAINGSRTDIVDMLARMVRLATPIALGALAGILCERSGVVNIAIEGLMLTAACIGFIIALTIGNTWIGLLAAIVAGGVTVMLHALLSIRFKIDQIISGTVINILAVGVTGFLRANLILPLEAAGSANGAALQPIPIPLLADIPVIGPIFFDHRPITYLMLILVPVVSVLLFRTPWGLRTRAIGEHPRAADTMGINVNRMRYMNVFYSGLMAGLAGAWFSLEATFNFDDLMTNGRGFIALAAMIFGKWTPFGALGGALIFSSADALQIKIQGFDFALPAQFLQMLPYLITIVVLAGVIGRARPPAAVGKPYEK